MSAVTVTEHDGGLLVAADRYRLWLPTGRPYGLVTDPGGQPLTELFLVASVNTCQGLDGTDVLAAPHVEHRDDAVVVVLEQRSSLWAAKRTRLVCTPDHLALTVVVEGSGDLTDVHLLGGYYSADIRHASGFHYSGSDHASVFNPEPWGSERRMRPATESTILDVLGSSVPGKEHWLFTPPPLCLGLNPNPVPADGTLPPGPWLVAGIGAAPGRHTFTGVHYEAVEGAYGLRLTYEGHTEVSGAFATPTVFVHPGIDDAYAGIRVHTDALVQHGLLPPPAPKAPPATWWSAPIFCGWGSQCVLSGQEGGGPQEKATQANYDRFLAALTEADLAPGTVVLDDKWQRAYGLAAADEQRWPDLAGWIADRHRDGQRVLLWWKAWDPEGVPPELCVRNTAGVVLGVDPSNPGYETLLRAEVRRMLAPDGYDADGFKIDFSARTPSGPGLTHHGPAWGMELLHQLLWIIYDEAKRTKADALVMTHTPHPYFRDVTDMIRLNDINTRAPVVDQMVHRARVASAACPDLLIDTDNWPMPDPESFRAYVAAQPELGVPSLYYATHLDRMGPWSKGRGHVRWADFVAALGPEGARFASEPSTHEPLTSDDHALIRDAWARAQGEDHRDA